ncbi:hypothetical protein K438DRAFT_1761128 [Mycena galopus ATCC 62051]|nr:hypothetical protein K438DRAFT_1761128 [Mycena galopus ATCC 62051]
MWGEGNIEVDELQRTNPFGDALLVNEVPDAEKLDATCLESGVSRFRGNSTTCNETVPYPAHPPGSFVDKSREGTEYGLHEDHSDATTGSARGTEDQGVLVVRTGTNAQGGSKQVADQCHILTSFSSDYVTEMLTQIWGTFPDRRSTSQEDWSNAQALDFSQFPVKHARRAVESVELEPRAITYGAEANAKADAQITRGNRVRK